MNFYNVYRIWKLETWSKLKAPCSTSNQIINKQFLYLHVSKYNKRDNIIW